MGKTLSSAIIPVLILIFLTIAVANEFAHYNVQKKDATAALQYATVTLFTQNAKPLPIKAEVAATEEQVMKGLMFRTSLGKNDGMLFVFPTVNVQYFWMKNTLIPLDMVFIAENGTIVKIHHAVPCKEEQCQIYSSEQPVKYVLEVNGNFTIDNTIREGGKIVMASYRQGH